MKRFTLEVDGKKYEKQGSSLEEVLKPHPEYGVPKVWDENRDKIVEEDITDLMESIDRIREKRKVFDALIADESVLDNLIADLTARKNQAS